MIKRICCKFNAFMLSVAIMGMFVLSACAGLAPHQEAVAKVATQYATLKFIDGKQDRATKVKEVTAFAVSIVEGDATTTVDALEAAVRAQIHWEDLKPEDALLLNTLITAVRVELELRLADANTLPEEVVLRVAEVLSWVNEAAALVAPQASGTWFWPMHALGVNAHVRPIGGDLSEVEYDVIRVS